MLLKGPCDTVLSLIRFKTLFSPQPFTPRLSFFFFFFFFDTSIWKRTTTTKQKQKQKQNNKQCFKSGIHFWTTALELTGAGVNHTEAWSEQQNLGKTDSFIPSHIQSPVGILEMAINQVLCWTLWIYWWREWVSLLPPLRATAWEGGKHGENNHSNKCKIWVVINAIKK